MARTSTVAQIGKRTLELSNLRKALFPEDNIVKAELIEFYLRASPTILRHIKGRPLSFVRFPDGIHGQSFYQKNRQDWAPDWIEFVSLGEDDKIDYVLATEDASLVWLANLACIELHQMHCRQPRYDKPDYIVFDLDPPEQYDFTDIVQLAFELREYIERQGYHVFVKTTGGKGVHLVAPIEPKWTFSEGHDAAAEIAKVFVEDHTSSTTLHVKKNARQGKVFVDIHRNRTYQTIVSAYSVRGRERAPVSTPLTWEELESLTNPADLNIHTVLDRLIAEGDPWETIGAYSTELHTKRSKKATASKGGAQSKEAAKSLERYGEKRSFDKTPEPASEIVASDGNGFVVQRHHASRLHYDLRLERDGTLKSWAVPKGLPPRPGIKRLAVAVEDHPLKYLNFQGVIPKGQYGGGVMWVFVRGKYETTKQKKDGGFYFRTHSQSLNAEYRMIYTRGNDWLMERVDTVQIDWLRSSIEFMLSNTADEPFDSPDYLYEVKWDGIRAMISLDEEQITIRSRKQREITHYFPELLVPDKAFRNVCGLFDAEIVCLDENGKPDFEKVVRRLHNSGQGTIERAAAKSPAVCYVFDCLYLDGRPIVNEPLTLRREWLADSIRKGSPYRVSEVVDEGVALHKAVAQIGLEGIMAKRRDSPYVPGRRSPHWIKVKSRRSVECVIIGYTKAHGDRASTFGALHIGCLHDGRVEYLGKVGTGFDDRKMKEIRSILGGLKNTRRPFPQKPLDDDVSEWVQPSIVCEVRYASRTKEGHLREPVFVRLRPDLDPTECSGETL